MKRIALFALCLALAGAAAAEFRRGGRGAGRGVFRAPRLSRRLAPSWYPRAPSVPGERAPREAAPPRTGSAPPRGPARAAGRAQVIVQGRELPDPPAAPPARARLDARRDGGGELLAPPASRDGRPLTERPLADRGGRVLAPGAAQIALIGRPEVAGPIADLQSHWLDRRDHGYSWRRWGGVDVAHHYDERGFHWWGFYSGGNYFWTRWHDGRYWWFDPYWRRWCFLYSGWWWWPSPTGAVYLYDDSAYENCLPAGGGVLLVPDQTPPVFPPPPPAQEPTGTPPPEPPPPGPSADSPRFTDVSADGSRSVEISGARGSAYLYDLAVSTPGAASRTGQWLADGVGGSRFVYEDKLAYAGVQPPLKQIELAFEGSPAYAVVDPAGARKVFVTGDVREASLINLLDAKAPPVALARGVTDVSLVIARDGGRPALRLIIVSADDAERGAVARLFTPDGALVSNAPFPGAPPAAKDAPPAAAPKRP